MVGFMDYHLPPTCHLPPPGHGAKHGNTTTTTYHLVPGPTYITGADSLTAGWPTTTCTTCHYHTYHGGWVRSPPPLPRFPTCHHHLPPPLPTTWTFCAFRLLSLPYKHWFLFGLGGFYHHLLVRSGSGSLPVCLAATCWILLLLNGCITFSLAELCHVAHNATTSLPHHYLPTTWTMVHATSMLRGWRTLTAARQTFARGRFGPDANNARGQAA